MRVGQNLLFIHDHSYACLSMQKHTELFFSHTNTVKTYSRGLQSTVLKAQAGLAELSALHLNRHYFYWKYIYKTGTVTRYSPVPVVWRGGALGQLFVFVYKGGTRLWGFGFAAEDAVMDKVFLCNEALLPSWSTFGLRGRSCVFSPPLWTLMRLHIEGLDSVHMATWKDVSVESVQLLLLYSSTLLSWQFPSIISLTSSLRSVTQLQSFVCLEAGKENSEWAIFEGCFFLKSWESGFLLFTCTSILWFYLRQCFCFRVLLGCTLKLQIRGWWE